MMDNLIKFLDKCEEDNTPVEVVLNTKEPDLNTPVPTCIHTDETLNNFVDLTLDSWLTVDFIGISPAVEDICPTEIEKFFEDLN